MSATAGSVQTFKLLLPPCLLRRPRRDLQATQRCRRFKRKAMLLVPTRSTRRPKRGHSREPGACC